MQPTAYRVKRPEPLAISDVRAIFSGDLSDKSLPEEDSGLNVYEGYAKHISATITGRETTSGQRVKLGEMTADLMQVMKAMASPYGLW